MGIIIANRVSDNHKTPIMGLKFKLKYKKYNLKYEENDHFFKKEQFKSFKNEIKGIESLWNCADPF